VNRSLRRIVLFTAVLSLAAMGQLAAKAGALRAGAGDILNPLLALSLLCLLARALLWAVVLRRERLVFAYPVMALAYPMILVLAHLIFGETLTVGKAAGSLLVVAGVALMTVTEARL
jgi:drug/metabolite transporter (DMT)-like permease